MIRLLKIWGFLLTFAGCAGEVNAQFNPQAQSLTDKFFPETDIQIPTPAFAKDKGFTTLDEMKVWLAKQNNPAIQIKQEVIGKSQKGKEIIAVRLSKAGSLTTPKVRVWLQGGLHGDEPAGTESMLFVIHSFMSDLAWQKLLDRLDIMLVPMANVDGYEALRRESANGIDLNRDQTRLSAPESGYLKAAFSAFNPEVALDFHEFRPFRRDFTRFSSSGVTTLQDAMFLYSGNLNVPASIRSFTQRKFVNSAKQLLNENCLRNCDYVTTEKVGGQVQFNLGSVHSRSSASNYALTNAISTLFEIRGVGIGRTSFKRRVRAGWLLAKSYLTSAYEHADSLRTVLAQAQQSKHQVVVKIERKKYKDTLEFIDVATEKVIPLRVTVNSALESKPILARQRPTAYLINLTEKRAISNLKLLGIAIDSLTLDKSIEVESFNNLERTEEELGDSDNEESGNGSASANTVNTVINFPKGTYVVWLDQQRANLACEVLEPENPNGFVSMKVITEKAGALPIYRYLKPERP